MSNNIRDRSIVAAQLWDWAWLNPAFGGTKARLSDVDGIVEQDRHLLLVEAKPTGFIWPEGNAQFRTLKTFSGKSGCNAIVLYGSTPDTPAITHLELVLPIGPKHLPRVEANNVEIVGHVARWFQHTHECTASGTCFYDFLGTQELT